MGGQRDGKPGAPFAEPGQRSGNPGGRCVARIRRRSAGDYVAGFGGQGGRTVRGRIMLFFNAECRSFCGDRVSTAKPDQTIAFPWLLPYIPAISHAGLKP